MKKTLNDVLWDAGLFDSQLGDDILDAVANDSYIDEAVEFSETSAWVVTFFSFILAVVVWEALKWVFVTVF